MSDVFISYAREDLGLAQDLAEDLKGAGYRVWWDAELVGSDDFYEVILSALSAASAAIVIWTKSSVRSRFVRDEARFALYHDKLIATKTDDLEIIDLPFGFQGQHTERLAERERICSALKKLGVKSEPRVPEVKWDTLKDTRDPNALVEFIASAEDSATRRQAAQRLMELAATGVRLEPEPSAAPAAKSAIPSEVKSLTTSKLRAFLQGLFLHVPEFQLDRQGFYSSIGVIVSVMILCGLLVGGVVWSIVAFDLPPNNLSGALGVVGTGISSLLLYKYSSRFFASKNWAAGALLSLFLLFMNLIFAAFVSILIVQGPLASDTAINILVGSIVVVEAVTLIAIYRCIRRAQ